GPAGQRTERVIPGEVVPCILYAFAGVLARRSRVARCTCRAALGCTGATHLPACFCAESSRNVESHYPERTSGNLREVTDPNFRLVAHRSGAAVEKQRT